MVCPFWGGSVGLSWGVGGGSVGSVLVEETVSFSRGENLCVRLQGGGILESVSWGKGSVYHYFGEFASVWRGRRVFASALWERSLSAFRGGAAPSDSHCPLSPGQRSTLRARLSLGPRPPAASRSGLRRPGDERPWRRLRALRLPRLPRRLRLRRRPRMLKVPAQLRRSQRPLAPAPRT